MREETEHADARSWATASVQPEVLFVNAIETLQQYLGCQCRVEFSPDWATLVSTSGRALPCEYQLRRSSGDGLSDRDSIERLAQMALEHIGVAPLHNQTLRPFCNQVSVWHPLRVQKFALSSEFNLGQLIHFVVLANRCPDHSVRFGHRQTLASPSTGRQLCAYSVEFDARVGEEIRHVVVEPRAFFSDNDAAIRDTLIHAIAHGTAAANSAEGELSDCLVEMRLEADEM